MQSLRSLYDNLSKVKKEPHNFKTKQNKRIQARRVSLFPESRKHILFTFVFPMVFTAVISTQKKKKKNEKQIQIMIEIKIDCHLSKVNEM